MKHLFRLNTLIAAGLLAVCGSQAAPSFYTSGSNIKDANDNTFVIRGMNHPVVWHYNNSWNTIDDLDTAKYNSVRIVWDDVTYATVAQLSNTVARCIQYKLIPMLEFHGVTGSNSRSELERAVNYWTRSDIRAMVNQYKQYIILNIANEWGGSTLSDADWKNEYKESLTTLRNYSEYRDLLIVIDSNEWAQDPAPVKTYGQEILNHDAARRSAHGGPNAANVAFGIHMYGRWDSSNPSKFHVSNELATFKNTCNFPIIVGEFGYNHNNGNNNLGCTVSHTEVMSACQTRGYGYMAWSTDGNDSANSWLDMMDNWSTWTWWGLQVRDNANGIIATSVKCSLFGGGSSPITIYADALASDWANWSWNSTVDLNNSSPVKNGTKSIKVTANAGWSALSLRKGTAQSTAGKTKITFWVHGGTGSNKSIKVYASTADSGGDTTGKIITATANTWTAITVNLSEIGNPASIKRLHFQNNSSTSQPAVYFDDIKLE